MSSKAFVSEILLICAKVAFLKFMALIRNNLAITNRKEKHKIENLKLNLGLKIKKYVLLIHNI